MKNLRSFLICFSIAFFGQTGFCNVDLTISNAQAQQVNSGGILNFTFDLTNTGTSIASGDFIIASYVSTDPIQSYNDYQDGIVPTGNIGPGTISGVAGALTLPTYLADGNYYLIVCVDTDDAIDETNEDNNCFSQIFSIGDDPCPVSVDVNDSGVTIYGLAGTTQNTNIFDVDWNPVWTCNPWDGPACDGQTTVVLPPGYYHVAMESSLCSFYELVQVIAPSCDFVRTYNRENITPIGDYDSPYKGYVSNNRYHIEDLNRNTGNKTVLNFEFDGSNPVSNIEPIPTAYWKYEQEHFFDEQTQTNKLTITKKNPNGFTSWTRTLTLQHAEEIDVVVTFEPMLIGNKIVFTGMIKGVSSTEGHIYFIVYNKFAQKSVERYNVYQMPIWLPGFDPMFAVKEKGIVIFRKYEAPGRDMLVFGTGGSLLWEYRYVGDTNQEFDSRFWFSRDKKRIYYMERDYQFYSIRTMDLFTGQQLRPDNNISDFPVTYSGGGPFKMSFLPTRGGGGIIGYQYPVFNQGDQSVYGRVDRNGNYLWFTSFPDPTEFYRPRLENAAGEIIFATVKDLNTVKIIKTDADGNIVSDCNNLIDDTVHLLIENNGVVASQNDDQKIDLHLYPNPTINELFLEMEVSKEAQFEIQIINARGKCLFTKNSNLFKGINVEKINVADLPKGFYFVNLWNENGIYKTEKFVK